MNHAGRRMLTAVALVATAGACGGDDTDRPIVYPFDSEVVSREPCPESRFECVTITVPRDHYDADSPTWEVTYAIQPAAVERRGTFVTITGGPGSAGIASADSYTDLMASQITDFNDIVFLNQRGSGFGVDDDRWVRCDDAIVEYYRAPVDPLDPAARDEVADVLQRFVDDCLAEGDVDVDDLPYYATRQAAEDLELVRGHLGVDQFALYGESYGTQFVQTYAAAHPDRVSSLFLDGAVDLTVESLDWYDEAARAYEDALTRTMAACDDDPVCAADAGGDAAGTPAAYDRLAARLGDGPIAYDLPMPDGSTEPRELTADDVTTAAAGSVGSFSARMQFLRVLTAAAGGNLVPLARMSLSYSYLDPETLDVVPDGSYSDALYYAVECQDYAFYPGAGSPRDRLDRWLDDFAAGDTDELRMNEIALGDLPCLYWPAQPAITERPAPIVDPQYPTFVLTADTDPATPMANALRIHGRLDDSYLVVLQDGPHVIFDWGYACVDDLVADFLGSGERPATRVTICDGDIIDPYAAIAPDTTAELDDLDDDPLATMASIESQLLNNVEYSSWFADDTLEFGCDFGGTVAYEPTDNGTAIELDDCEFTDGYPITGAGLIDDEIGGVTLDVATPSGSVAYDSTGNAPTVSGDWNGTAVTVGV